MSYPHRIRLRGPWEVQLGDAPPCRQTMPASWHDFSGQGIYRRAFGYPGRIDDFERIWLTFERVADRASVELNGLPIGECEQSGEFEVTRWMQPRNELVVTVQGGQDGGLVGEVALEVRARVYLRDVSIQREDERIVACGEVLGEESDKLELYLIVDRRVADYQVVTPGQPFCLRSGEEAATGREVAVELVRGASTWYRVEANPRT